MEGNSEYGVSYVHQYLDIAKVELRSDVKRLTGEKVFELGKTVQLLHQYLSMTDPRATDDSHPLVSLDEFGFKSSSEVLNLVSAVSPFTPF